MTTDSNQLEGGRALASLMEQAPDRGFFHQGVPRSDLEVRVLRSLEAARFTGVTLVYRGGAASGALLYLGGTLIQAAVDELQGAAVYPRLIADPHITHFDSRRLTRPVVLAARALFAASPTRLEVQGGALPPMPATFSGAVVQFGLRPRLALYHAGQLLSLPLVPEGAAPLLQYLAHNTSPEELREQGLVLGGAAPPPVPPPAAQDLKAPVSVPRVHAVPEPRPVAPTFQASVSAPQSVLQAGPVAPSVPVIQPVPVPQPAPVPQVGPVSSPTPEPPRFSPPPQAAPPAVALPTNRVAAAPAVSPTPAEPRLQPAAPAAPVAPAPPVPRQHSDERIWQVATEIYQQRDATGATEALQRLRQHLGTRRGEILASSIKQRLQFTFGHEAVQAFEERLGQPD